MESLGINPVLIGAQILHFIVLLVLFKIFLYKPLIEMMQKRQKEIDKGLELTSEMVVKESDFLRKQQDMLSKTRAEGRQIIQQAVNEAKEKQKMMIEEERSSFAKERERLMEEIANEKEAMFEEAKRRSVDIAVLINEKMFQTKSSKDAQNKFIQQALSELKKQTS